MALDIYSVHGIEDHQQHVRERSAGAGPVRRSRVEGADALLRDVDVAVPVTERDVIAIQRSNLVGRDRGVAAIAVPLFLKMPVSHRDAPITVPARRYVDQRSELATVVELRAT